MEAERDASGEKPVTLPRWPHKGFLTTALVLVVAVGAGGLATGWVLRGNDEQTLANAERPVEVTAKAESKTPRVDTFEGTLDPGEKVTMAAVVPEGATSAVVTSMPRGVGDPVNPGDLVAAVSDRPVFALRLTVPLFRALHVDDEGVDVHSLNQSLADAGLLSGTVRDVFSSTTTVAIAKLYKRAGFTAPGEVMGSSLEPADILNLPKGAARVAQRAALNSTVAVGAPVVTLQTAAATLEVRVDAATKAQLEVGGETTVSTTTPAETRRATIGSISAFHEQDPDSDEASGDTFPGYDVGVKIDFGVEGNPWSSGARLTVAFPLSSTAQTAVPLTAVREKGSGATVEVERDGAFHEVCVTVTSQQDGWALIGATKALAAGDTVLVHR